MPVCIKNAYKYACKINITCISYLKKKSKNHTHFHPFYSFLFTFVVAVFHELKWLKTEKQELELEMALTEIKKMHWN